LAKVENQALFPIEETETKKIAVEKKHEWADVERQVAIPNPSQKQCALVGTSKELWPKAPFHLGIPTMQLFRGLGNGIAIVFVNPKRDVILVLIVLDDVVLQ
jgi:hypothetical protein